MLPAIYYYVADRNRIKTDDELKIAVIIILYFIMADK